MQLETANPALGSAGLVPREYSTPATIVQKLQRLNRVSELHAETIARLASRGPQGGADHGEPGSIARDTRGSPRAFLSGCVAMAAIHLEHALGDAVALQRSMQKFAACTKATLDTLPEAVHQIEHGGRDNG